MAERLRIWSRIRMSVKSVVIHRCLASEYQDFCHRKSVNDIECLDSP